MSALSPRRGPIQCVLVGAGGHAKVLIDLLGMRPDVAIVGALDADPSQWGQTLLGVEILGGDELMAELVVRGATHFAVSLGSVGSTRHRAALYATAKDSGLRPLSIVHPSAVVSSHAVIGDGAQLLPLSVVNAAAVVGANVLVNTGAIVEHDCFVGDNVHVATGARLCGGVVVKSGAHIGAGAIVRQGLTIGEGAVVGAGAVVVREVPPGITVAGVPARPLSPTISTGNPSHGTRQDRRHQ